MSILDRLRHAEQQRQHGQRVLAQTPPFAIWHGAAPMRAPAGTLVGPRGNTVDFDVYVLSAANFERAEQAIALCIAHGLMAPVV